MQSRPRRSPAYNPPKTSCGRRIRSKLGTMVYEASNSPASIFQPFYPIRLLPAPAILLFPEHTKLSPTSGPLHSHLLCWHTLPLVHLALRSSGLSQTTLVTYTQCRSQLFHPCSCLNFQEFYKKGHSHPLVHQGIHKEKMSSKWEKPTEECTLKVRCLAEGDRQFPEILSLNCVCLGAIPRAAPASGPTTGATITDTHSSPLAPGRQ